MKQFSVIILAAGEGKRMKSKKSKLLHEVCQKPMVEWVCKTAEDAGATQLVTVVGHLAEQVTEALGDRCGFALQAERLGTGHAVMQAVPQIDEKSENVVILYGDAPLLRSETLTKIIETHESTDAAVTVATTVFENSRGYGRIIREKNGSILKIVEEKDCTPEEAKVKEVNVGIYCFKRTELMHSLGQINNNNAQNEYYLTDTVGVLKAEKKKVVPFVIEDTEETLGANDRVQIWDLEKIMRRRINEKIALSGVTIIDPDHTYISVETEIGQDTVILPGTIISGKTVIGSDCTIGPNSRIVDSVIGDETEVQASVMVESKVGSKTHVGPFAYLRPKSQVGNECKVGDFVELKNVTIGDKTKTSHLTYLGDADIGSGVNFGCGTVMVNYDGVQKFRSSIGNDVFVGCNTNLVSPVHVGDGVFIAAGSTITEDIPDHNFAIARSRQVTKDNWKDKRKKD